MLYEVITIANNPNMMYPCEVCGVLIYEGNMCDSCRNRLARDISAATREEEAKAANQEDRRNGGAYGVVDKFRAPERWKPWYYGIIFFINQWFAIK